MLFFHCIKLVIFGVLFMLIAHSLLFDGVLFIFIIHNYCCVLPALFKFTFHVSTLTKLGQIELYK